MNNNNHNYYKKEVYFTSVEGGGDLFCITCTCSVAAVFLYLEPDLSRPCYNNKYCFDGTHTCSCKYMYRFRYPAFGLGYQGPISLSNNIHRKTC